MLREITCVSVLAALGTPLAAGAGPVDPPRLAFETHTLDNGLRVILAPDRSRPIVNVQLWYHVGSKDEKEGRTGFAHLFEHLMFRGSKNVGPEAHMRYIREAGGVVNAYTSFDQTVYWETVPSNQLRPVLWLEADRMASLDVSEENFTKEREVVKEERRLRFENPPFGLIAEDALAATFAVYPYKYQPIGSMADLNAAGIEDVRSFHRTFYVPDNATLVLVGDFDPAQALAWAREYFGPVARSATPVPRVTVTEPPQTAPREVRKSYANAPLPAVVKAWKLPSKGHPDSYALAVASDILSSGQSSRLYRRLVYDEQAAVAAAGQLLLLEGPSILFGFAVANQGKDIAAVERSFQEVLNGLHEKPVTDEELEKAKNTVVSRLVIGRQSMQQKATALGDAAVLLGDPARYNTEVDAYQRVTAADVQRVVRHYLTPEAETRIWVSPAGK